MTEHHPADPAGATTRAASSHAAEADTAPLPLEDFRPSQIQALDPDSPDLWPESADGQCSEMAALFAQSQPAPLNVV